MILDKYSFGIGDRFSQQGEAQLKALIKAREMGIEIVPVWNKSNREHQIIKSLPEDTRCEADQAVKALGWKHPYYVFENIANKVFSDYPALNSTGLKPSLIAKFGLIVLDVGEILFWGGTIFYFTRQKIKDQFKPFKGNSF